MPSMLKAVIAVVVLCAVAVFCLAWHKAAFSQEVVEPTTTEVMENPAFWATYADNEALQPSATYWSAINWPYYLYNGYRDVAQPPRH